MPEAAISGIPESAAVSEEGTTVRRGNAGLAREIRDLRRALRVLDRSLRRFGPLLARNTDTRGASNPTGSRRRPRLSPAQRAALKLQGRYIGFVRQLKAKEEAVQRIRASKGVREAIGLAPRLLTIRGGIGEAVGGLAFKQ